MRKFSIKRPFGVELEVSNLGRPPGTEIDFQISFDYVRDIVKTNTPRKVIAMNEWSQSVNNNYWHVKYDATCGELGKGTGHPRGWEVASFKASGYDDLLHIANMANILHTMGVRVNDHCGLHVHVDISDFTICQAAVLVARWIKAEYWMKQAVPKNRRRNKYCKFLTSKKKYDSSYQYTPEEFWYKIRPTNFCPHENAQKKVTLNMVNYAEFKAAGVYSTGRPTVELRLPEGTLNGQDIINWVVLFLYFVESS